MERRLGPFRGGRTSLALLAKELKPGDSLPTAESALISGSAAQTKRLGRELGQLLCPHDLILLEGPLGGGKTCFVQGLAQGLGVRQTVISPSFTLVRQYALDASLGWLYHIDLYRIQSAAEAWDFGLEEYLEGEGICVVEWAEKAMALWPAERLHIRFQILGSRRRGLAVLASGARFVELLERWPPLGEERDAASH